MKWAIPVTVVVTTTILIYALTGAHPLAPMASYYHAVRVGDGRALVVQGKRLIYEAEVRSY